MSRILPAIAAVLGAATYASAGLVTFTDLPNGGNESAIPTSYQPAGLPASVTTTFGEGWLEGPAEESLGFDDDYYIFIEYPSSTIAFSEPVDVSSLYLINGSVVGQLEGVPVAGWSATAGGTWTEVTVGDGLLIDELVVTSTFAAVDALTVNAVPEPVALSTLAMGAILGLRRRRA